MKIATWNLNSLRTRLPQLLSWLDGERPDLLALQETKLPDPEFPAAELLECGYHALCAGQPAYNGVALLSRVVPNLCFTDFSEFPGLTGFRDPQRRVLAAVCTDVCVLNLYVPNGSEVGSPKYAYKLSWLERLQEVVRALLRRHEYLLLVGDLNIAPEDRDVWEPRAWKDKVLCSAPEREHFQRLLEAGLEDCLRKHHAEGELYSWWDYRNASFQRNQGLRIDHILASASLTQCCLSCHVDKRPRGLDRPSDHAPVIAEFELPAGEPDES